MGLFGKKEPCPICGGKIKGIFNSKIDGQHICNDCYGIVDLPQNATNHMSVEDFRGYMAFREENLILKQQFQVTQKIDFGFFDTKFMFDMGNRLLCMDKHLNKTIFEGKNIKSFVISEDSSPLYEGSSAGLRRYTSAVQERVMALEPQINQFRMQVEMQRNAERLIDRLDGDDDNNNNHHRPTPRFDVPEPFQNFYVEIRFEHPYWDVFTADMGGPRFSDTDPDVNDYLRDYTRNIEVMEELARTLMEIAFPGASDIPVNKAGAQMTNNSGASQGNSGVDVVEEIQRYKMLMDQGVITEEEFTAKKRQLLGI